MIKMFIYLVGILEKEETRIWKRLVILNLISPVTDIFSFSVIIYIVNIVIREQHASKQLIVFTVFMGMVSVLIGIFDLYKQKIHNHFIYHGAQILSEKMYGLLLKEDLIQHNGKNLMQILTLVRNDTQSCMNIIITSINIVIYTLTMAGYFVVMIFTSRRMGVISCLVFVLLMVGMFFVYRNQMQTYGETSRMYAIRTNAQITIAYGNFKEIKIANNSAAVLQRYHDAGLKYAQTQQIFQYKKGIISMLMQNFVMTAMYGVLAIFLWQPGEDVGFFLASMVVYLTMFLKMIPLAYGIVSGLNDVKFSQKSYEELREGITEYEEIKEAEKRNEKIRRKNLTFQKGICIQDLTFKYNDRVQVFRNAYINIPVGHSIAITGVSGIGKTTFLDLVLGLLTPQSGKILYDDYDIVAHIDEEGPCIADIGSVISYIPQTVYLNGETICSNVAFFSNDTEINYERVEECLKWAQVWEDIEKMPEGVHTLIGENGMEISGGQRQRIALARALYRDFELLVMDEATAALDLETEKAVIDSIRQIKKNKTILVATHHMSLANECDMIYRIENFGFVRVK